MTLPYGWSESYAIRNLLTRVSELERHVAALEERLTEATKKRPRGRPRKNPAPEGIRETRPQ
jgi:hypothetical protein